MTYFRKNHVDVFRHGNRGTYEKDSVFSYSTATTDTEQKRVYLIDRETLQILHGEVVRGDVTRELPSPLSDPQSLLLLALDHGGNYNADVFDRCSPDTATFVHGGDRMDYIMAAHTNLKQFLIDTYDLGLLPWSSSLLLNEFGEMILANGLKRGIVLDATRSLGNLIDDITVNKISLRHHPRSNWRSVNNPIQLIALDTSALTGAATNVEIVLSIEDYPDIADAFDVWEENLFVTTIDGTICEVEVVNWNDVAKTGLLYIQIPSIPTGDRFYLAITNCHPLTLQSNWVGEDYIYACSEEGWLDKYHTDGTKQWDHSGGQLGNDNVRSITVGWKRDIYGAGDREFFRIDKDSGARQYYNEITPGIDQFASYHIRPKGRYFYIAGDLGLLHKMDAETGTAVWSVPLRDQPRGMIILPDGDIYINGNSCNAMVYSKVDGSFVRKEWGQTRIPRKFTSGNTSFQKFQGIQTDVRGNAFAGGNGSSIFRLGYRDKYLWRQRGTHSGNYYFRYCAMTPDEKWAWVGFSTSAFYAIGVDTGVRRDHAPTMTAPVHQVACGKNGNGYFGDDGNNLRKIELESATTLYSNELWARNIGGDVWAVGNFSYDNNKFMPMLKQLGEDWRDYVWNDNHDLVFHFEDTPAGAGSVKNSVVSGIDGDSSGMDAGNLITGKIGSAYSFNGSDEDITVDGLYSSAQSQGQVDILFRTTANTGTLIAQDATGWNNLDSLIGVGKCGVLNPGNGYPLFETHGPNTSEQRGVIGTTLVNDGNWHALSVRWDGVNYSMCIDGTWETDVASTYGFWGADGLTPITIGSSADTGPNFAGDICELIIRSSPKTKEETTLMHNQWLNGLIEDERDNNDQVMGCDVGLRFDNDTIKVYESAAWREVLTKNAAVHGGEPDGRWYMRNDSSGVPVYETSGTWVSKPISLNGYDQANSLLNWTEYLPLSGTITVSTHLEQSAQEPTSVPVTWDTATLGMAVPNMPADLTNYWLWIKIEIGSSDSSETSAVSGMTLGLDYSSQLVINCTIPSGRVSADLTDFPVKITLPYLHNMMDGYSWENLHVTSMDGLTEYTTEIVNWKEGAGLWPFWTIWVKLPSILTASDNEFKIWLDNTDNSANVGLSFSTVGKSVYDSNFLFVSHCDGDGRSDLINACGTSLTYNVHRNNFHPINNVRKAFGRNAILAFGSTEYISFGGESNDPAPDFHVNNPSVSILFNRRNQNVSYHEDIVSVGRLDFGYVMRFENSSGGHNFTWGVGFNTSSVTAQITSPNLHEWHAASGSWDGQWLRLAWNEDACINQDEGALGAPYFHSYYRSGLLHQPDGDPTPYSYNNFDGMLADVLISNVARSAAWLEAMSKGLLNKLADIEPVVSAGVVNEVFSVAGSADYHTLGSGVTVNGNEIALDTNTATSSYRLSNPLSLDKIKNYQGVDVSFRKKYPRDKTIIGLPVWEDFSNWHNWDHGMDIIYNLGYYSSGYHYNAFRDSSNFYWARNEYRQWGHEPYFGLYFEEPKLIGHAFVEHGINGTPNHTFLGSNDRINWDILFSWQYLNYFTSDANRWIWDFHDYKPVSKKYQFIIIKSQKPASVSFNHMYWYSPCFQTWAAVVDSPTEPTTPPVDTEFQPIGPESDLPGVSKGDNLEGKWVWFKQILEGEAGKTIEILDYVATVKSGLDNEITIFDKVSHTETNVVGGDAVSLDIASGGWQPTRSLDEAEAFTEAVELSATNRMTPAEMEALDNATLVSGGLTGPLAIAASPHAGFNSDVEVVVDEVMINDERLTTAGPMDLPDSDVVNSLIHWNHLDADVYAKVTGGNWQQCTQYAAVPGVDVGTNYSGQQVEFRVHEPITDRTRTKIKITVEIW